MQSVKNVPNDCSGNADVLVPTAKTRQSEQGALKRGGIDLLVMPPKLKGRLPLWRVCSVNWLRGLVKPRNYKGRALEVERQIVQMRPAQRRPVTAFGKTP